MSTLLGGHQVRLKEGELDLGESDPSAMMNERIRNA